MGFCHGNGYTIGFGDCRGKVLPAVDDSCFSTNPTPKIALHGYWRSGSSWRLRIVLNLKGLDFEYKAVNLLKGEQKGEDITSMNPMQQVPVLEIDGQNMTESMAICEYIEEKYGHKGTRLLPNG